MPLIVVYIAKWLIVSHPSASFFLPSSCQEGSVSGAVAVSSPGWMFLRSALLTTCFVLLSSSVFAQDDGRKTAQFVTDCIQLQEALNRDHVTRIVVSAQIRCTRESWQVPVVVQRNVEITGDPVEANFTSDQDRPSIDWADISHVVIVERAVVSVHDLVMYQNELGVGGLTVAFIHTREGAAAVFAGVVVILKTCSQPVRSYHSLVAQIPRPVFLAGSQKTETIGSNVLLVQDLAVWWPNLNSVWQLCNGMIVCVDGYKGKVPVNEYYLSGLVVNSCATIADNSAGLASGIPSVSSANDRKNTEDTGDSGNGHETDVTSIIIIVAVVVACIMFITALISYRFICLRSTNRSKSFASRRDQISIDEDSPRDVTSSRYLSNRNDMEIDLFERGTNVPLQDVVIGSLLGRGGFGKVYKGTWKGTAVAIKVIVHGERLLQNELKLPFEAYLSRHISHPNVVQTFLIHTRQKDSPNGITVDTLDIHAESPGSTKKSGSMPSADMFSNLGPNSTAAHDGGELFQTWLVLEFCDRGSLSKAIKKGDLTHKQSDTPLLDHILLSALDVANAMNYLHSLGITHGDLKADNVLLKSASTDRRGFFCKVSDFGLSRYVGDEDYLQTFTYGTITHMPPELIKHGFFSTAVDIYSFGILLWELLAVTPPYPENNAGHILMMVGDEGQRPPITDRYPPPYADLIKDCWKQNREDRPKFSAIVRRLKDMLAQLEINQTLMRNVNDSVTSHETVHQLGASVQGAYMATMPDRTSSHSVTFPPNIMFVSEPTSFHSILEQNGQEGADQELSRHFSAETTDTLSLSPKTSNSEFSCFDDG